MTNSTIHTTVMRRVRTIYALQSSATGVGVSVILIIASLYLIGREVWVARVWENMPSLTNYSAAFRFFTYAFVHTHVIVQALILLTLFAAFWLLREMSRVFVTSSFQVA